MTIDKAIEELSGQQRLGPDHAGTTFHTALGLGIEALKAVRAERLGEVVDYRHPLPGETE